MIQRVPSFPTSRPAPAPRNEVLIVDDDPDIRDTVSSILSPEGYRVSCAGNGREALELLRTESLPHLILLDLMMPIMDGQQFQAELAQDPELAKIPIVVVTAGGNARQKAEAIGASDWLQKPFELDGLMDTLKKYCRTLQAERQAGMFTMHEARLLLVRTDETPASELCASDLVADTMSPSLLTIAPETLVSEARRLAAAASLHHLLVFGDPARGSAGEAWQKHGSSDWLQLEHLCGVTCVVDLESADPNAPVSRFMRSPVLCIDRRATLFEAARMMREHRIGCLPVTDSERLVGVVTRGDLRRTGVPDAQIATHCCAACGSHHHVRLDPHTGDIPFCLDCLDSSSRALPDEELGVGD